MPRILYNIVTQGGVSGGHKVMVRHVEALRELGFEAICYLGGSSVMPAWFEHDAPFEVAPRVQPDDIVVIADDAAPAMRALSGAPVRTVILSQNPYLFSAWGFDLLDAFPAKRFPPIIAVSDGLKATICRAYPQAAVEVVPCFADERRFAPGAGKTPTVAFAPRKRPLEAPSIRALFERIHPRHAGLAWTGLERATEREVAEALSGAALFLSLSRLESVGMTTLEAMASGCLCAGFTGVGGREFATADNGFWAADDDCEGAADALAGAADLAATGGPKAAAMIEAGQETARRWSHARFRIALEETWMRLAPEMRQRR